MLPFAVELNDRAIAFAREGRLLSTAPSAVWDGSTAELAGTNAWGALRRHPTATSTRHLGAVLGQTSAVNQRPAKDSPAGTTDRAVALLAVELVRRLAASPLGSPSPVAPSQAPEADERVWIATPARATQTGLSALLAIARTLSLPVDGFVDAAVASVAALGLERDAIVLEIGLHHAAATYVDRGGIPSHRPSDLRGQLSDQWGHLQWGRRRSVLTEGAGLLAFYQGWLELVSSTMVKRTRFDPLHDAPTEQRLFDSLDDWARAAEREGSTNAALTKGDERFEVALTRDQFAQAGQALHREIVQLLHELRPAGAPLALVVPAVVAHLPGLRRELESFVDCELVSVPDGFAARAVSRLDLPERAADAPVRLLRRLPDGRAAKGIEPEQHDVVREKLGSVGSAPTHLLLDRGVYALSGGPLEIGRSLAGPRTIALPEGLAGVSRRHCTVKAEGNDLVLLDHSSFGTFLNGERVADRARLRAGDRIRVGDPGVELSLIVVSGSAA